jgi:hypothetical protein
MDYYSDCQNESKHTPPKFFPQCFGVARILGSKTATFCHAKIGLGSEIHT